MKVVVALCFVFACTSAGTISKLPLMPMAELESRITNGEVADRGQFPYQVCLKLVIGDKGAWCGGTLISDRWIVTAAHCTVDADGVTVFLGANNITMGNEKGQQRVYVSKSGIITHAQYNPTAIRNDIALIKLPVQITFDKYVQPAVLPKKSGSYSTYVGNKVIATGWGKEKDSSNTVSEVLNYIESVVITQRACNRYFLGSISNSMICMSGREGRSTCNGDSGGPLVYKENEQNVLIGATSFGIALGCEIGWPGVFTRITSYLDWIESQTGISN